MSHRKSSSTPVRCVKPSLEILEDRTLLSAFGDLVTQFGAHITAEIATAEVIRGAAALDSSNFENHPSLLNFALLYKDATALNQYAAAVTQDVTIIRFAVSGGEKTGLLTGFEATLADATVSGLRSLAAGLRDAAQTAMADAGAAFFALLTNGPPNQTPIPANSPSTGGGYGVTYADPPGSAPSNGPNIGMSASITASAGNDAPITATMTCTFSDGTATQSNSVSINPGDTQPLSLSVMPCTSGSTANWTVTIDGNVDHTATTVFQ